MPYQTFSSREYEFCDIEVFINKKPLTNFKGLSYKTTQEKEVIRGRGNKPYSIQHGGKSYEGTIELYQSELDALQDAALEAGGNDIMDLRGMNIVISYAHKGSQLRTITIRHAEFTDCEESMNQDDKYMTVSLPFIALDIVHGKTV